MLASVGERVPGVDERNAAEPGAAAPRLSVIVPATDRPATLERCREAILGAIDPPEELIVVDEAAGAGPAAARNAGAQVATGSILVFVDSDVIVHRDAFVRIRSAFAADPGLGAVFGSYDDALSPHGLVSTFRNLLHHHIHHSSEGPATTFWAGLGASRRETFLAVGGFDAGRFPIPSVEDIDLGLRLAAADATLWLDPSIQGTHLKLWRLPDMVATDLVRRGMPWMGLLIQHGPFAARLNASWRNRLGAVVCAGALVAASARSPRTAVPLAAFFFGLNVRFYELLLRRGGPRLAAAGVGLHILHNVTACASAPIGAFAHALRGRRRREADAPRAGTSATRFVRALDGAELAREGQLDGVGSLEFGPTGAT
jgi:hypothetical protein